MSGSLGCEKIPCSPRGVGIIASTTDAEQELDPRFDIREFHSIILENGAIPLDVLEANVKRWLAEQANAS